jgi:hypothetical protein
MKKLFILTVVTMAALSAPGCRCLDWLCRRGDPCVPMGAQCCGEISTPCESCGSGCSSCSGPQLTPSPTVEVRPGPVQ